MTDSLNVAFCSEIVTPRVAVQLKQYEGLFEFPEHLVKHEASDLKIVSTLEKQAFCEVLKLKCKSQNSFLVMKRLDDEKIRSSRDFLAGATDLATEARFLSKLDHENIIKLHGVCGYYFTVEFMRETLKDRLKKWSSDLSCYVNDKLTPKKRKLDEQSLYDRLDTTALGIANAMEYLHDRGIVLRDLTPSKIGYNHATGHVRLLDFSFARYLPSCKRNVEYRSLRYTAPEVRRGEGYSLKSDVYSFGVILYEIASLNLEWRPQIYANQEELSSCLSLEDIPSGSIQFLIEDCLSDDPKSRPSFDNICMTLSALISSTRKRESLNDLKGPLVLKQTVYVSGSESHCTLSTIDWLEDDKDDKDFECFDELSVVEC